MGTDENRGLVASAGAPVMYDVDTRALLPYAIDFPLRDLVPRFRGVRNPINFWEQMSPEERAYSLARSIERKRAEAKRQARLDDISRRLTVGRIAMLAGHPDVAVSEDDEDWYETETYELRWY